MTTNQQHTANKLSQLEGSLSLTRCHELARGIATADLLAPEPVTLGWYRNDLGVELEIIELYQPQEGHLGSIWLGKIPDQLFGPRYVLVSPDGLQNAGYQKITKEQQQ